MAYETFISLAMVAKLYKKLIKLRKDRAEVIDEIASDFVDPIPLSRLYVQPYCQEKNPADFDERQGVANVKQPVFDFLNNFFNSELVESDGRKHLFVLSDAGMGKTSLLLILRLSYLLSFWPKTKKCEILKLSSDTLTKIRKIKSKKETILLLDALDEDTKSYGQIEERIANLIHASSGFYRVIVSCRTQFFPEGESELFGATGAVEIEGFICPKIFLSLFDDRQVAEYLDKKYQKEEKKKQALRIVANMGSLRFRPLLLSYMDEFLKSGVDHWSEYEIFTDLVKAWLFREERKFKTIIKKKIDWRTLLKVCVLIAVDMQKRGRRYVHLEELGDIVKVYPEVGLIEKFDVGGRSLLNRNSDGAYRFSHYSIQEYLVAKWLKDEEFEDGEFRVKATDTILGFLSLVELRNIGLRMLDFEDTKVISEDFHGVKRHCCQFANADFSKTNFSNADFTESDFSSSTLTSVTFNGSKLLSSNFDSAHGYRADFTRADCRFSNFNNASLRDSFFVLANLSEVNFERTDLTRANLTKAVVWGANFSHADFTKAKLDGAFFVECDLTGCIFNETTFRQARFFRCELDDADFSAAFVNDLVVFESRFSRKQQSDCAYELIAFRDEMNMPEYEQLVAIQEELEEFADDLGTLEDLGL